MSSRTDARSAGRNCLQVMPSKEEENSHSEVKEEKPAYAGLTDDLQLQIAALHPQ